MTKNSKNLSFLDLIKDKVVRKTLLIIVPICAILTFLATYFN
jgi:hypothetical protein